MKQLSTLFFIFSFVLIFNSKAAAQYLLFDNQVPAVLDVCQNEEGFVIEFKNNFGNQIRNILIRVEFPTGVYYSGNLDNNSNWPAYEYITNNPSSIWFKIDHLPKNKIASFSFNGTALPEAINGGPYFNHITVYFQNNSSNNNWWFYSIETDTDNFEVVNPVLNITSVSPMTNNVVVNQIFTRSIVVKNTGNGSSSGFDIFDIHSSDLKLESVNLGTLNAAGNKITLSGTDFQFIGNGNSTFDPNETITINEVIKAINCGNTTSQIYTQYGCNGQTQNGNSVSPNTTITSPAPALTAVAQPSFNTCVSGSPDQQQLVIENNGVGVATDVEVDIFQYAGGAYDDIFSKIDVNNIYYKLNNGAFQQIIPSQTFTTSNSGVYSCLGTNPKGRFILQLPNLSPGNKYTVRWMSTTCATNFCGEVDLIGWKYNIDYSNGCGNTTFETDGIGQENKNKNFTIVPGTPANIEDGDVENYSFLLSSADFNLPEGNNAHFDLVINIPDELTLPNGTSSLTFSKAGTLWAPGSISLINGQLTASYSLPAPFALSGSTIGFSLGLDCNATSPPAVDGNVDVELELTYTMDTNCANPYQVPVICETFTTNLQCSGICPKGLSFDSFEAHRTTFGAPDNNQDGMADASGTLNLNNVALGRVMVGDEFSTTFSGVVKTSWNYPSFEYGYATSTFTNGDNIELISATVSVYDYNADATIICNNVPFSSALNNGVLTTYFDFSPASLEANGCFGFTGFQFDENDVITLIPVYKVNGNIGAAIEDISIENSFYVSNIQNPSNPSFQFSCGDKNGNITLIGYEYLVDGNESVNVTDCDVRVGQNYHFGLGNCCDNSNWVDLFPYEYRNWSLAKTATVEIPEGYVVQNIFLRQKRLGTNGAIITQNHPLSPISINGNTYTFDLTQALTTGGGTINPGDGSFEGSIFFDLLPQCDLPLNQGLSLIWDYNFLENILLGGGTTIDYSGEDLLTYQRADLQFSTDMQTVDGIEKTISWEFELSNNSQNIEAVNTWLNLESVSNNILVEKLIDLSDNSVLFPVNGLYQLGTFAVSSTKNFKIVAGYNSCALDDLQINAGYDCTAYPVDFSNSTCNYQTYNLSVNSLDAKMAATLDSDFKGDENNSYNTLEIEVSSLGEAYLKDIVVTIEGTASQSLLLQADSTKIEYPVGSGFEVINTPSLTGNSYIFTDADLDVNIFKFGLPGLSDPASSSFKLKFNVEFQPNFASGDALQIKIDAKKACGTQLPTIEFTYDPNQVFSQISGIGVPGEGNNWGVSWADYDNDGDPDLFITNNDDDKPNELYTNNGDGTFTAVTEGPIATDIGNSVGSSWGDYDNDGDLDLYVSNTIGFPNFLYRNNGDGTFIRVMDDPIVSYTGYSHGVSWGDYDNDGYLDMFVADYYSTKFNLLYHNNQDGTFTQVTNSPVVLDARSSVSGSWCDYDNDGDLDLFVANTNNENNLLYRNDGGGDFVKITSGPVVNDGGKSVGSSWGDIDNDGDFDLFVANAGGQNNFLYKNNGDGTFNKVSSGIVVSHGGNSHGSSFGDFDNDGDLDLVVTNDANEGNFYYVNNGDGTFESVDNSFSSAGGKSLGVASADYDLDGDLDLYVVNHGGEPNFFYRNDRDISKSLINYSQACVALTGTVSNNIAIGAVISVRANIFGVDTWQTRQVTGQSGGGLSSQNDILQHFGLGDATQIDEVIIQWPSGYTETFGAQTVGDCITFIEQSGADLTGITYYDANGNCSWDAGETLLPNTAVNIQPGNRTVYSDINGEYTVNLQPGTYTVNQNAMTNWDVSCAIGGYSITITDPNLTYTGNDFGNSPSTALILPDLEVALASTSLRVGFESLYAVSYGNTGTAIADNAVLAVDFGNFIIPKLASIPWDNQIGTTYYWDLGSVAIGFQNTIYVYDSISVDATIGDLAAVSAEISSSNPDLQLLDNSTSDNGFFVGAFDPNDMLVFPEGNIKRGDELTYKIRFQNVGNASVKTVVVRNELPDELAIESIELGAASHPYRFWIEEGNTLVWSFENIYLPDSTSDELNSHGFVTYRIIPKEALATGTKITNKASIYFDNNPPIVTNEVLNTLIDLNAKDRGKLMIYPNPLVDASTIEIIPKSLIQQDILMESMMIFDALGRMVYNRNDIGNYRIKLNKNDIKPGYYVVRVIGEDGNEYIGKLVVH